MAPYFTVRLPNCYQCTPWPPNYFAKCETLFPGLESPILDALENESGEHHWTHEATTPFGISCPANVLRQTRAVCRSLGTPQ